MTLITPSGYNRTQFARATIGIFTDVQNESVNEAICIVDPLVYAPYANLTDYRNNAKQFGALETTWERVKWQISDDNALAPVPYLYLTSSGHVFGSDSNGVYLNDGLSNATLTNSNGNNLYKCNTLNSRYTALNAFMANWQQTKQYQQQQASVSNFSRLVGGAITYMNILVSIESGNYYGTVRAFMSA